MNPNQVTGTFKALNDVSPKVQGRRFMAAIGSYGGQAFTGTVNIMWIDGAGLTRRVTDSTGAVISLTAAEQQVAFDMQTPVTCYLQCTALSAGNIPYFLGGARSVDY